MGQAPQEPVFSTTGRMHGKGCKHGLSLGATARKEGQPSWMETAAAANKPRHITARPERRTAPPVGPST